MTLDILDYLDLKEEDLSLSALSFVRTAQEKKDALDVKLKEDKEKAYYKLLKNGVLRSSMFDSMYGNLQNTYNQALSLLVDDLDFQLKFLGDNAGAGGDGEEQAYNYPYNPDYSLDSAGRYYAVYNYYMTMTDAKIRFALFQADKLAPDYLGEFYSTLYDRLKSYADYE